MSTSLVSPNDRLTVSIALTSKIHEQARRWAIAQNSQQKAKQVYLNTLAVYAVDRYLRDFLIETDLEASESWSPGWLSPPDVADLVVTNVGRLECRPVLRDAMKFRLPESAWDDRVAYVAVRLQESLQAAELVGYLPAPEGEPPSTIAISQLSPIVDLLTYVQCLEEGNALLESDDPVAVAVREIFENSDRAKLIQKLERIYAEPPAFRKFDIENLFRTELRQQQAMGSDVRELVTRNRVVFPSLAATRDEALTEGQVEAGLSDLAEQLLAKLDEIWGDH